MWTPSHKRPKTEQSARAYIEQICADTGYSLEDLPWAMDDRDGGERGSGRSVPAARHDDGLDITILLVFVAVLRQTKYWHL